jgi:hypothetical protein
MVMRSSLFVRRERRIEVPPRVLSRHGRFARRVRRRGAEERSTAPASPGTACRISNDSLRHRHVVL